MSKSIIFLVKSILGEFYRHLAIFSGHTAVPQALPKVWKVWNGPLVRLGQSLNYNPQFVENYALPYS